MSGGVPAGVKLSPCPFCGSEAEFFGYQGATKAKCSNENCEAETGPWFADIDCNSFGAAAKNWNTRATPTPPIEGRDADVERVDRIAAWPFAALCFGPTDYEQWLEGAYDEQRVIQAFASHRRAALQALGERP